MDILYLGAGSLQLATKQLTVVFDPFHPKTAGLKLPKVKADVVAMTQAGAEPTLPAPFIINTPGEYEIKGLSIQGIAAQLHIDQPKDPKRAVMYRVEHKDVKLLLTGNIAPKLSDEQVEDIGQVDVLVLPVGGHGLTLDGQSAAGIVNQLEPRLIVPIHYDDGVSQYDMPQDKVDTFLKEIGYENPTPSAKHKVTERTLPEDTEVVLLKPTAKK